jgi:hypothetical protein
MATLQIQTYCVELLEQLCDCWNAATVGEPAIARLTPERFQHYVATKSFFDPSGLFAAVERGRVLGWVHACVAGATEPWQNGAQVSSRLRMLLFPPDRLDIGLTLIEEASRWLAPQPFGAPEAMSSRAGYPMYRGLWLGGEPVLPATMPHAHAALEIAGYRPIHQTLGMAARMAAPPEALAAPADVELCAGPAAMKHEAMRESWTGFQPQWIDAMHAGEPVGSIGWVLLPELAEKIGAPGMSIWTLSVRDSHRRRGIADHAAQATYIRVRFRPTHLLIGRELRGSVAEAM